MYSCSHICTNHQGPLTHSIFWPVCIWEKVWWSIWYTLPRRYFPRGMRLAAAKCVAIAIWFKVGSLALPQKMNLHSHMFRHALYSTLLRGPSFMWFWIYDLYPLLDFTPICLVEPLYSQGYTDPEMSRPVIMYTSARVEDIGPWPKRKALTPFDQKWQDAIRRFSFFGVSAKDNSKHWAMRRLYQLLVLTLLSASILLCQFLQPAIGGRGQFLKASCHRGGPDKAALKGILLDSAAMNSRGSEVPTGPRK
jgi:hypothetical protein